MRTAIGRNTQMLNNLAKELVRKFLDDVPFITGHSLKVKETKEIQLIWRKQIVATLRKAQERNVL